MTIIAHTTPIMSFGYLYPSRKIETYVKILRMSSRAVNAALKAIGVAGLAGLVAVAPNATQGLALLLKKSKTKPSNYAKLMSDLKRRGLVHVVSDSDNHTYSLTPAGALRLQQLVIDELEIPEPKKWDKKWRLISFDIPVKYSAKRAEFTQQLQSRGFLMLHKSLWVHPFPCFSQIEKIASHYNVLRYCSFIQVEKFDELSTKRLLRHFKDRLS